MLRLVAVTVDVPDPTGSAGFWSALLDRDPVDDGYGVLLPGDGSQVGLRFAAGGAKAPAVLHLHLTSGSELDQRRTVESAIGLGPGTSTSARLPRRVTSCLPTPAATRSA
jgi:hypothetical protein